MELIEKLMQRLPLLKEKKLYAWVHYEDYHKPKVLQFPGLPLISESLEEMNTPEAIAFARKFVGEEDSMVNVVHLVIFQYKEEELSIRPPWKKRDFPIGCGLGWISTTIEQVRDDLVSLFDKFSKIPVDYELTKNSIKAESAGAWAKVTKLDNPVKKQRGELVWRIECYQKSCTNGKVKHIEDVTGGTDAAEKAFLAWQRCEMNHHWADMC